MDLKEVARIIRGMDDGTIPFVVCDGEKYPINDELIEEFGLVSGQRINKMILDAMANYMETLIVQYVIKMLSDSIDENNTKEEKPETSSSKVFESKTDTATVRVMKVSSLDEVSDAIKDLLGNKGSLQ